MSVPPVASQISQLFDLYQGRSLLFSQLPEKERETFKAFYEFGNEVITTQVFLEDSQQDSHEISQRVLLTSFVQAVETRESLIDYGAFAKRLKARLTSKKVDLGFDVFDQFQMAISSKIFTHKVGQFALNFFRDVRNRLLLTPPDPDKLLALRSFSSN